MNELIQQLNTAGIRYLLIGGQAMRLAGMPRYSQVKCLSSVHLLAAKQAAGRPQDQADIEFLLELQRLGKLS